MRDLEELVARYRPDLLHLQEVPVGDVPERIGALRRATSSSGVGYGVALFVRTERFRIEDAIARHLPRSLHDRLRGTTAERLGAARIADEGGGERLVVGTLHATPLTDPNLMRRRQIDAADDALRLLGPELPAFLAGDFNYPHFTRSFDRALRRRGYTVSRSDVGTFHGWGPRGAFDIAVGRGLVIDAATTLPRGASDHRPVRFDLRFEQAAEAQRAGDTSGSRSERA